MTILPGEERLSIVIYKHSPLKFIVRILSVAMACRVAVKCLEIKMSEREGRGLHHEVSEEEHYHIECIITIAKARLLSVSGVISGRTAGCGSSSKP